MTPDHAGTRGAMSDTSDQTQTQTQAVDPDPDFNDENAVAQWISKRGLDDGERNRRIGIAQAREDGRPGGAREKVASAIDKARK